jgi:hypothetical protein
MDYCIDTEFIEDGKSIDLISIALVCADGREFYAENLDCKINLASEWVQYNVIPHLWNSQNQEFSKFDSWIANGGYGGSLNKNEIKNEILKFCDPEKFSRPTFWGYYADYDWVVFCQLFGKMIDLPKGFPMYCMDLKQWCKQLGDPILPEQINIEHHALTDARWNQIIWHFLYRYQDVYYKKTYSL